MGLKGGASLVDERSIAARRVAMSRLEHDWWASAGSSEKSEKSITRQEMPIEAREMPITAQEIAIAAGGMPTSARAFDGAAASVSATPVKRSERQVKPTP